MRNRDAVKGIPLSEQRVTPGGQGAVGVEAAMKALLATVSLKGDMQPLHLLIRRSDATLRRTESGHGGAETRS